MSNLTHLDFPKTISETPTDQELSDLDIGLQNLLFHFGTKGFLEVVAKAIYGHSDGHGNSLDYVEGKGPEADEEVREINKKIEAALKVAQKVSVLAKKTPAGF